MKKTNEPQNFYKEPDVDLSSYRVKKLQTKNVNDNYVVHIPQPL